MPPLGSVHCSSMAHWKARGDVLLVLIELFFASSHGWGSISKYRSKLWFLKGERVILSISFRGRGRPPTTFGVRNVYDYLQRRNEGTRFKLLPFVAMQRVARVCQRQLSYLLKGGWVTLSANLRGTVCPPTTFGVRKLVTGLEIWRLTCSGVTHSRR